MIFSDSPVKNIAEKLNPLSQRNKISKLKFERKKDYKTFLDFIKKNTKELEQRDNIVEKTKKVGLVAGGLGIAALLFGSARGKKESDSLDDLRKNLIPKAIRRSQRERERDERRGTESNITGFQKAPSIGSLLSKLFQKRDTTYRNLGVGRKEYTRQNVKSKRTVKESIVNQEKVYNQNRKKKKTLSTTNITVKQPVGAGAGSGKITPPERPQIFNNPVDRINADRLKKGLPPLDPNLKKPGFDIKTGLTDIGIYGSDDVGGKSDRKITKGFRPRPPRSGSTPFDFDMNMNIEPPRVNDKNFKNLSRLFSGEIGSDDLDRLIEIDRFFEDVDKGKKIKLFDRRPKLSDRFMFNPNTNRAGGSRFTSMGNFFGDKSFTAPDVPKGQPKLSGFDKFNRFTNRIMNSPAYKFGSFIGGMMTNYKLEIIKQLLTPTPLADGTLEGKPGVGVNPEKFVGSEGAVNIFLNNNNQSMIPFNPDLKFNNDVIPPTDFPTPSSNIFIDPKQQLNIDDIFFLRSFSGG